MKIKHYISLTLALILCCLAFASCGGSVEKENSASAKEDNNATDSTGTKQTTTEPYGILTVPGQTPNYDFSIQQDNFPSASLRLEPYSAHGSSEICDGGISLPVLTNSLPKEWISARGAYQDETAPESVTVTLFGENYTYEYIESYEYSLFDRPQNHRTVHVYGNLKTGNGYVKIDAATRTVVAWRATATYKNEHNSIPTYSVEAEELKQIAEEYIKQLVGEEQFASYEYTLDGYNRIYFYRKINGYKTNEYIYLNLMPSGKIAGFNLYNIGLYSNVTELSFDEEQAKTIIDARLDERYLKKYSHYNWSPREISIVMLPNGQIAYNYYMNVDVCIEEEKIEEGEYAGETFCMMGGELLTYLIIAK
jgi:hypothetical protein